MKIREKGFQLEIRKAVDEAGTFEGYASVFNVRDSDNEIVVPGAFTASLVERRRTGRPVAMLWQHDRASPIGVWEDLAEDAKGLYCKGRLVTEVQRAKEAHALLKADAVQGLSIGFQVIEAGPGQGNGPFELRKLDLREISIVTFAANPRARVEAVKSDATLALEDICKFIRDGEAPPPKDFEKLLRDAGLPRALAVRFGAAYAKIVRSESDDDQAEQKAKATIEQAINALSSIVIPKL